jgi:hypothetical protein
MASHIERRKLDLGSACRHSPSNPSRRRRPFINLHIHGIDLINTCAYLCVDR